MKILSLDMYHWKSRVSNSCFYGFYIENVLDTSFGSYRNFKRLIPCRKIKILDWRAEVQ